MLNILTSCSKIFSSCFQNYQIRIEHSQLSKNDAVYILCSEVNSFSTDFSVDINLHDIILKLTVFSVHLNSFYTHTIENVPLNMVFK